MSDEKLGYNQTPSLDEIVFENRNKAYGAYDLRQSYRGILTKSFIIGTILFCTAAITPFVVMKIKQLTNPEETIEVDANLMDIKLEDEVLEQPEEEEELPPPPPPKPEEQEQVEIIQNVVPEPVKAPKVETPPPPISKQLETTTGLVNQEGVKKPDYAPPPPPPTQGTATKTMESKPQISTTEVYAKVDQEAEYPGGMNALRAYLADNFDSSVVDAEGRLKATLRFIVERDGTVSDVKVVEKSGNRDFDDEAVRVVKKLKKWKPGKLDGQNVRSRFSVPFVMEFQ